MVNVFFKEMFVSHLRSLQCQSFLTVHLQVFKIGGLTSSMNSLKF